MKGEKTGYNADGEADPLWCNTTIGGEVVLWQMNCAAAFSAKSFDVMAGDWAMVMDM